MAIKTRTVYEAVCGNGNCGKVIKSNDDGFILKGAIQDLNGYNVFTTETSGEAYCWKCLATRFPHSGAALRNSETVTKLENQVRALESSLSTAQRENTDLLRRVTEAEDRAARASQRADRAERDSSSNYNYSYNPPSERSGGPTGPLPPPEMPHYVSTTRALSGVNRG